MVKEMARQTELQKLMDSATRLGATIMGVKACSIKLLDEEGRYLRFASTYGLSRDYVSKGAIEVEKSPINKRILEGAAYSIGTISRKDYFQYPEDIEREGIASMLCLPLKAGSRVLGVFCVYSDRTYHFREADTSFFSLMTDLTAMAIERLRSELSKTWFFNKAAHQLRAPLHALMSMLRVVKEGYLGPITERQLEVINRCENRLRLMGQLIDDLMRLGERRARRLPLRIEPLHIGDIARRVVSLFAEQAEKKGVSLQLEISDPVPNVLGEEGLLDEVVTNLVSNAVKYTPGGGTVRVSIGKEGRAWVKLEVSDTGIGIPKSELPHLFSEFFRASNAREMEEEGTGLGLVIVKEALERLRGSIQVKTKEGEGTTFTCLIPSVLQPMERAGETDGTEERD
jgi:signal transduction histidine kinase